MYDHSRCQPGGDIFPELALLPAEEASDAQWQPLYQLAQEIRRLKPWQTFYDSYLLMIELPNRTEPVFVSVMGKMGVCYGLAIYPGYEALLGYIIARDAPEHEPYFFSHGQQNCFICYFGAKDELLPEEYQRVRRLGYHFRGEQGWIYLRLILAGYAPLTLTPSQVAFCTDVFTQALPAYRDYIAGKVAVDFQAGQLLRRAQQADGSWQSSAYTLDELPLSLPCLSIADELFTARMRRQKCNSDEIELDLFYLPFPIQEGTEPIHYPRVCMLASHQQERVIGQYVLEEDDDADQVLLGALHQYVTQLGRPSCLYVRDYRMYCYLQEICSRSGIELAEDDGLPLIDLAASGMIDFMTKPPQ